MPITYKSVLTEAVRGYNKIQNALSEQSAVTSINSVTSNSDGNITRIHTADEMVNGIKKLTANAAGSLSGGTLTVPNSTVTLEKGKTTGTRNITSVLEDSGTTEPTSGYYIAIKGNASAITASRSAVSTSISAAGYIGAASQISSLSSTTKSNSATNTTEYFKIPSSTCSRSGISTGTSNTSGLSITHRAGYIEASTYYITEAVILPSKTFKINNTGEVKIDNNINNIANVTGKILINTVDSQILVENNTFDVKDSNGTSLLASIDGLLTSIENILNIPVGSENEIITIVNEQTSIIEDIESLLL